MDTLGPAPTARLELGRSEERQPQENPRRKANPAAAQAKPPGKLEEDRAEVAAVEPETHQLDERA